MEQLLISRTIQLLNSEVEPANIQQLKDEKEKLEAEVKVMNLEVSHLKTRESKGTCMQYHYNILHSYYRGREKI